MNHKPSYFGFKKPFLVGGFNPVWIKRTIGLGGGFRYVWFSSLPGGNDPIWLVHMFQMGWWKTNQPWSKIRSGSFKGPTTQLRLSIFLIFLEHLEPWKPPTRIAFLKSCQEQLRGWIPKPLIAWWPMMSTWQPRRQDLIWRSGRFACGLGAYITEGWRWCWWIWWAMRCWWWWWWWWWCWWI